MVENIVITKMNTQQKEIIMQWIAISILTLGMSLYAFSKNDNIYILGIVGFVGFTVLCGVLYYEGGGK
jgi:hypothetical protein